VPPFIGFVGDGYLRCSGFVCGWHHDIDTNADGVEVQGFLAFHNSIARAGVCFALLKFSIGPVVPQSLQQIAHTPLSTSSMAGSVSPQNGQGVMSVSVIAWSRRNGEWLACFAADQKSRYSYNLALIE
jgi:hypothetical protein